MDEMKNLVDRLNHYRDAYYNQNTSLISDREYDALFDRLVEMEKNTGVVYSNSPTQTVGYAVVSKLKKVKHNHSLLSLDKTTEVNEFAKHFGLRPVMVMGKMDGLTCSLTYRNGSLVLGESRGDGEEGEDITHNVLTFTNLPKKIPFLGELIIDGECIIDYETFERINAPLIEKAEKEAKEFGLTGEKYDDYIRKHSYANPRNLASGSVRQLDSKVAAQRSIRFVAWKLHSGTNTDGNEIPCVNSFNESFNYLSQLGFEIVPCIYDYGTYSSVVEREAFYEAAFKKLQEICKEKQYPIDGCTASFDDRKYGDSLGATGHHPRHSMAFKFYQEETETILRDIEWSTSRTGLVNPVAIFKPIEIDGTIVTRATLNNVSIIKELELGIGDKITVIKANQIIPKIMKNLTRSNTYQIPTVCPDCGEPLIIKNDNGREMLYCTNAKCPAIMHDKISNFATRDAMNIVGISDERLRALMDMGYITDFESIYKLKEHIDEIITARGFGEASVDILLDAIEESRKCKLQNVIVAIGIPGIGKSAAKTIAKHCQQNPQINGLRNFIDLSLNGYDWGQLPEIGEVTSNAINSYISDNINEIEPLVAILEIEAPEDKSNQKLAGKTFCITGKLVEFINRHELIAAIEKNGGIVVSSVTAKTNYLITNDKTSGSSKNKAAEKFGTEIITEQEFIAKIS